MGARDSRACPAGFASSGGRGGAWRHLGRGWCEGFGGRGGVGRMAFGSDGGLLPQAGCDESREHESPGPVSRPGGNRECPFDVDGSQRRRRAGHPRAQQASFGQGAPVHDLFGNELRLTIHTADPAAEGST